MTVENTTNKKRFQGDGVTDVVTFNFRVIQASDIKVYDYPEDLAFADLEDYLLIQGVDYEVTLDDDGEGGEIDFGIGSPVAADHIGLIANILEITQTADLPTEGNFNETAVETALDRLVMQNIQQQEQISRGLSLRLEDPLAVDGFAGIFIEAVDAADRALRVLTFNATGDGVEGGLLSTDLADLNAIADDISTVAGIAASVTTVASIDTEVVTVAGIAGAVSNVSSISGAVTTVSGINTEVVAVSAIAAEIVTVAGIAGAVSNVSSISAAVTTVSGISGNVTTVAGIAAAVSTVAGISAAVSTVSGISANVTTVAGISANVTTVAGISGNVTTVAGISANVTTVAGIAADVTTVAANIADIQNAEENANIAKAAGGFTYTYSTTTASADPGSGFLRFNNATLASATSLYISETTGLSQAIAAELATWDDSTSTVHSKIRMFKQADPSIFVIFNITGTLTDNGTWDTFTVAYVGGSGSFSNNDVVTMQSLRTGDKGDTGATGPAGTVVIVNAAGTADAITADFTPDLVLADNLRIEVVNTAGPNTITTPTLNTDGTGALTIKTRGSAALAVGDTGAVGHSMQLRYEATGTYWELLNPAKVINADISGTLTLADGSTATTQAASDNSTKVATTAYADAAAKLPFRTTAAATTVIASDKGGVVQLTGSTDRTWDATAVATLGANFSCELWNDSTGIITFDPNSTEQVDGLTTIKMYPGEHRRLTVNAGATAFTTGVIKGFKAIFSASGSLTVPPGYTAFQFEIWSGGGAGGVRTTTGNASGGSGGAYYPMLVSASALVAAGSTETITVAGTAAGVASSNANGTTGNNSSVTINGVTFTVNGGGGGLHVATSTLAGYSASGFPAGANGAAGGYGAPFYMGTSEATIGVTTTNVGTLLYSGVGGDVSAGNAVVGGGNSIMGGAGGGGSTGTAGGTRTGGTSLLGGAGGTGSSTAGAGVTAGSVPGGGGGAGVGGSASGAGAAGQVIIRGIV